MPTDFFNFFKFEFSDVGSRLDLVFIIIINVLVFLVVIVIIII